jgi:polyvinyl alcohol dehydrogenase (cytochrome)
MRGAIAKLAVTAVVALFAATAPGTSATADPTPGCAPADHGGGDWRNYGGTLDNARDQALEDKISADTVGELGLDWAFSASEVQPGAGGFHNTPIVADGCLYLATNAGWVFSVNADTSELNWRRHLQGNASSLIGGVITGSVAVGNGLVYVGVSKSAAPYLAALDQLTGDVVWTRTLDDTDSALLVSSPVLYDDGRLVFQGFMGAESTSTARGGYAIYDAVTGEELANEYTISDADYEQGYRGASIWSTAAVDPDTDAIYVGTGNPASKRLEHRHSNALIKIDGQLGSDTFGQIVSAYKGNPDQYVDGLDRQPVCDNFGDQIVVVWSQACLQMDLDFGASPNLFTDAQGRKVVGALQKSGVYHAVWADNLQRAWTTVVGGPGVPLNSSSAAVADGRIFVAAQPPSQIWGLQVSDGRPDWVQPIADGLHYQSTSVANGVVYTVDLYGNLLGFAADSGTPVLRRPVTLDVGQLTTDGANSSGIAIARNTLYVAVSDYVLAYRLN